MCNVQQKTHKVSLNRRVPKIGEDAKKKQERPSRTRRRDKKHKNAEKDVADT